MKRFLKFFKRWRFKVSAPTQHTSRAIANSSLQGMQVFRADGSVERYDGSGKRIT